MLNVSGSIPGRDIMFSYEFFGAVGFMLIKHSIYCTYIRTLPKLSL